MKYSLASIRSVELEVSTYCNAACPQCPRNYYGGKTIKNLPLINWSLDQLKKALDIDFIRQLELIYFCGAYGDPLMNPNLLSMCEWLAEVSPKTKLVIHDKVWAVVMLVVVNPVMKSRLVNYILLFA